MKAMVKIKKFLRLINMLMPIKNWENCQIQVHEECLRASFQAKNRFRSCNFNNSLYHNSNSKKWENNSFGFKKKKSFLNCKCTNFKVTVKFLQIDLLKVWNRNRFFARKDALSEPLSRENYYCDFHISLSQGFRRYLFYSLPFRTDNLHDIYMRQRFLLCSQK